MARKKTINLAVPESLLHEFNEVCAHYGHGKQKGLVLSAAILMFLEADPSEQGKALERIMIADVRSGVESLIARARAEQARRIEAHQAQGPDVDEASSGRERQSSSQPRLRAARKAGKSRKSLKNLPEPPESSDSGSSR